MPRLEVHAVNVSSKEVSGDFYDVVPAGERAFLLAIADVAGKGVPAALLSSMLQASLRTQAHTHASVATILENINSLVYRSTAVNQFATFFLARIEEDAMRVTFSNAGHNFPILFRRDGSRVTLERGGTVVGILEAARFEEEAVELRPGDRVVLYTDGVNEAENEAGELYGDERLTALVAALPRELSAREVTERILEGVRDHLAGLEAGDDMTVLVLRVLEQQPSRDGAAAGERPGATLASTTGQPA
jgi:sigma-B regulation protein RsbU (phosphoserine phosphatase)